MYKAILTIDVDNESNPIEPIILEEMGDDLEKISLKCNLENCVLEHLNRYKKHIYLNCEIDIDVLIELDGEYYDHEEYIGTIRKDSIELNLI